jgi:cytidylate kinase
MAPSAASSRKRTARPFIVAIDGPAGAGKSTVAKGVARALGFFHLDTGAMYRALTHKALTAGVDPTDASALAALARGTQMTFHDGLMIDGAPPGPEIRTPRVSRAVSTVSAHPSVRRELVRRQREMLSGGGCVVEGRDIGTVVFPRAPLKVFLTASIDERARRRHKDLERGGTPMPLHELKEEITQRDALDSTRAFSPLTPAPDAVILDSSTMAPREVIAEVVRLARQKLEPAKSRR